MPGLILGLGSIQLRPTDEPMLVSWYEEGTRYAVALRVPSLRRDAVKLRLINIKEGTVTELRLSVHPDTHDLTDGRFHYEVREPGSDSEIESCLKVIERSQLDEED